MAKLPVQAVSDKELLNQITSADIDHKEMEEYAEHSYLVFSQPPACLHQAM